MQLNAAEIKQLPQIKRLNVINGLTGIKPANLIGTINADNRTNLAIFSSVVHLGSNPALIGFVLRPQEFNPGHTDKNIMYNGCYTINHVPTTMYKQAHYTSAKFDDQVSEFDVCKFTPKFIDGFPAPFVAESPLQIGMRHVQTIPIELNGTQLIIGSIEHIFFPDDAIDEEGNIDIELLGTAGLAGVNQYYSLQKLGLLPFVKLNEIPEF
jgi:flavin reductase (DIM6/NTAB) family NADH-FMN oxidoreductase RutF